jgi:hypothetical protein
MRLRVLLLTAVITNAATVAFPQGGPPTLFQFTANDFWLNLHHYLYVLGRAHSGAADAKQPAVASAPDDEQRGLASLTDEERRTWQEAVSTYASGLSRQTSFFQGPLVPMTRSLANTGEGLTFPSSTWDRAARATLERAAPIYRKGWWTRHRAMNEQYVVALQQAIARDGPAIVAFLTRAYQLPWPDRPYPTHVVAYSNFQGAYSYAGNLMILSSNANPANDRWYPLEGVFHEGLHQWDDDVAAMLRAQATARGVSVPLDLSHVLIFFTAGEAVRRLHPEHVPMVDALKIWQLPLSGARSAAQRLRPAILQIWKPYLDGRGSRDVTVAALVAAAAAATP